MCMLCVEDLELVNIALADVDIYLQFPQDDDRLCCCEIRTIAMGHLEGNPRLSCSLDSAARRQ